MEVKQIVSIICTFLLFESRAEALGLLGIRRAASKFSYESRTWKDEEKQFINLEDVPRCCHIGN